MSERLGLTPSQTVGPFLHIGLVWPDGPYAVPAGTPGAIEVTGTVYDGAGEPVPDALVEAWQADPAGRFGHPDDPRGAAAPPPGFRGFARCPTDAAGRYRIVTLKPGPLPVPGGLLPVPDGPLAVPDGGREAPHLDLSVFARGLLDRVVTRVYFPDEDNTTDPVLRAIPDRRRRATLIATLIDAVDGDGYRFDIRLQGTDETVFFDV